MADDYRQKNIDSIKKEIPYSPENDMNSKIRKFFGVEAPMAAPAASPSPDAMNKAFEERKRKIGQ